MNSKQYFRQHLPSGRNKIRTPLHIFGKTGNPFGIDCFNFFNKLPENAKNVIFNNIKCNLCLAGRRVFRCTYKFVILDFFVS